MFTVEQRLRFARCAQPKITNLLEERKREIWRCLMRAKLPKLPVELHEVITSQLRNLHIRIYRPLDFFLLNLKFG